MALSLLWLGLTLLGALQTQAQGTIPNWIPAPPLSKVPLQPNFQADQVRGPEGPRRGKGPDRRRGGRVLVISLQGRTAPGFSSTCPGAP